MLRDFERQLAWTPRVENEDRLARAERVFVCGMGGSRLAGDLMRCVLPTRDITIHADFGAPPHADKNSLVVISSYSGETEETLDAFERAGRLGLRRAVVTSGGRLLVAARQAGVPVVEVPEKNIPPRLAVGYGVKALFTLMGEIPACEAVGGVRIPEGIEERGAIFAGFIDNTVPLIYASRRMGGLAYYWKVVLNETAKIHAFANVFPEAGHNEIEGFEKKIENISCITLRDPSDDSRVAKRMDMLTSLLVAHRIPVERVFFTGGDTCQNIFSSVLLANWTAYHLAKAHGVDPVKTELIEEWKQKLRGA